MGLSSRIGTTIYPNTKKTQSGPRVHSGVRIPKDIPPRVASIDKTRGDGPTEEYLNGRSIHLGWL
jgi:hypothetical protein